MSSLTSEARVKVELDAHGRLALACSCLLAVFHNLLLHHVRMSLNYICCEGCILVLATAVIKSKCTYIPALGLPPRHAQRHLDEQVLHLPMSALQLTQPYTPHTHDLHVHYAVDHARII